MSFCEEAGIVISVNIHPPPPPLVIHLKLPKLDPSAKPPHFPHMWTTRTGSCVDQLELRCICRKAGWRTSYKSTVGEGGGVGSQKWTG